MAKARPRDEDIARVIGTSASLQEAAGRLGYGKTWARRQAANLGVRSRYRLGVERLPDDRTLAEILERAPSVAAVARELGVVRRVVKGKAAELGIDPRRRVRDGLPDDDRLYEDIRTAASIPALARSYGVAQHHIRNQMKRLKVRPGSPPRPKALPAEPDADALRRRAEENQALFELASEELARVERERDALAMAEAELREELERLRAQDRAPVAPVAPVTLDAILDEAQETGCVHIVPKASRNARKVRDLDLARLRAGLLVLRDAYVPWRRGEISQEACHARIAAAGFSEDHCLTDPRKLRGMGYVATWQGEEILLERHLKWGTRNPHVIRIYFHWDEAAAVAVVGWMPGHLAVTHYS